MGPIRRVRTPGGREQYGQEIGEVIVPDPDLDWKPSMTTAEADRWATGSKLAGPFYHGARNAGTVETIMQSGFDIARLGEGTGNAGFAGAGFYLTGSRDYALKYAQNDDQGLLETRVNVQNPMPGDELWAWLKKVHPGIPKGIEASFRLSWRITEYAKSQGYDSIHVTPRTPGGNDELVLFDPRQVTVVLHD